MDTLKPVKLEVKNLTKDFGANRILEDINFQLYEGEFLSILGPSGCGKTTLLRILSGLTAPTSGTIWKDGKDITTVSPSERKMGIVFQNYALFENMTVLENVEYALKINPELKEGSRKRATDILELVGLGAQLSQKPDSLSGGQQQRVAIARTLALNPEIILFDEPMSALDVDTRLTLREEIKHIQQTFGTTMVYITHDQEEAFVLADRIMVMNKGHIEQLDAPETILDHPASPYVQSFVVDNLNMKINSLRKFARWWR